jgi:hypothetical protein
MSLQSIVNKIMKETIKFLVCFSVSLVIIIFPANADFNTFSHNDVNNFVRFSDLDMHESMESDKLSKKRLLLVYSKVLGKARYFGENIIINIGIGTSQYQITRFRRSGEDWNFLTLGHLIVLISQEISANSSDENFTRIDIRVEDKNSSTYHLLKMVKASTVIKFLIKQ